MDRSKAEEMRSIISKKIEVTKDDIKNLEEQVKPVPPNNAIGRLSRMEALNAKSVSETNLASAKTRLIRLERALKHVDDEDFGECVECGEEIPYVRLSLVPEITKCVDCLNG